MSFIDRKEAGTALAARLLHYKDMPDGYIIGLPRGGVVVAYEVAKILSLPLDVITPRKVGSPFNEELAIGAITHTGEGYFNEDIIREMHVSKEFLENAIAREKQRSLERFSLYRKNKKQLNVENKIVIIVDDGLATGATMKAAIQCIRKQNAKKIVCAVPVSPTSTASEIETLVDEFVSLITTSHFYAVGQFYEHFDQTSDEEVLRCLE